MGLSLGLCYSGAGAGSPLLGPHWGPQSVTRPVAKGMGGCGFSWVPECVSVAIPGWSWGGQACFQAMVQRGWSQVMGLFEGLEPGLRPGGWLGTAAPGSRGGGAGARIMEKQGGAKPVAPGLQLGPQLMGLPPVCGSAF